MTKMMRNDRQDLEDIRFILGREPVSYWNMVAALEKARVPEISEIRAIFNGMQPVVLELASSLSLQRSRGLEMDL